MLIQIYLGLVTKILKRERNKGKAIKQSPSKVSVIDSLKHQENGQTITAKELLPPQEFVIK